jgi:hypothetical protein
MRPERTQWRSAPLQPPRQRRLGGWYPVCTGGRWNTECVVRARGEMHGTLTERLAKKKAGNQRHAFPDIGERARRLRRGGPGVSRLAAGQAKRDGSDRADENGRPPMLGPVRSDRNRTAFFPSHSVLRTSFHCQCGHDSDPCGRSNSESCCGTEKTVFTGR